MMSALGKLGASGALTAVAVLVSLASLALVVFDHPPDENSPEPGFARDMSVHHAQAVEMAQIAQEKTDDPEIDNLASDMALTQQGQIGQMQGWLSVWGLPISGSNERMQWMGMEVEGRMPGMASAEELNELRNASGEEAEEIFLRLMIPHHEAAIPMANASTERSDNEAVTSLAEAIISAQKAEIQIMRNMLEQRGVQPPEDGKESMEGMEMQSSASSTFRQEASNA
ncbi:MAG: DUF305 domain-containing protein [Rubrobacter sp.]|nr:DUF305 domain-containing protein [Rubrobacter sp.]